MKAYPSTPTTNFQGSPSFPNASIGSATWLRTDPSYGGNPGKPELDPRLKHSGVTSLRVAIPFHSQPQFSKEVAKSTKLRNSRVLISKSFVGLRVPWYLFVDSET
jgi:hypothetical protein